MHNWLGQEVYVGNYVYRGARDGNSSTFKIGLVVAERNDKVRVCWLYENGARWLSGPSGPYDRRIPAARTITDSFGWLAPDSLFVMTPQQAQEITERLENEPN